VNYIERRIVLSNVLDDLYCTETVMKKVKPQMRVVSFYHKGTGMFHARHLMTSDPKVIPLNTPPDHIAIDGDHFDPRSQRVDVATGEVIDQLPPQPSPDHEWNGASRRWQLRPELAARQEARKNALERIQHLEIKALRALREHALGEAAATQRLRAMDDEIAQLRTTLAA
jgi:hypothetical protein